MLNQNSVKLGPLPKEILLMGVWGIALLLGGLINQYGSLSLDGTLVLWAVVTIVGLAGQVLAFVKGLGPNLLTWIGIYVLAWIFTLVALKANIQDATLFLDLPAVWFLLLGLGYLATAVQVNKAFYILAAIHLLFAILLEISLRVMSEPSGLFKFLGDEAPLLIGVICGGGLIVASIVSYVQQMQRSSSRA